MDNDTKYNSTYDFFSDLLSINIDKKLVRKIKTFKMEWCTKSDEYINFLSSNLLGVHKVSFSILDEYNFLEIFEIYDKKVVQSDFYNVKDINKNFNVISDITYHIVIYVAYQIYKSNLPNNVKNETIVDLIFILYIKMFTSKYNIFFSYNINENIATAVYERMSYKYEIKKYKSWYELFMSKSALVLDKHDLAYNKFTNYSTENASLLISDYKTKINSMLLSSFKLLLEIIENNDYVTVESDRQLDLEGEKKLRDITRRVDNSVIKVTRFIYNKNNFIDLRLVDIVVDLYNNSNREYFIKLLNQVTSDHTHRKMNPVRYGYPKKTDLLYTEVVKDIVTLSYKMLIDRGYNINDKGDIVNMVNEMIKYWNSSRVKDKTYLNIKKYMYDITDKILNIKTKNQIVTISIMLIIYIWLLSF